MCADFPDGVLPWRVEEIGSTGVEVWLSALAYGAVGIRIFTHERTPGGAKTLAQQIELIRCLLEGLDYDGQSVAEFPAVEFSSAHWPRDVIKRRRRCRDIWWCRQQARCLASGV
ncbi:MAG: hypothetical protein Ct9H300mP13_5950 [Gammaproteobacteria bacterium]|nr:MAG: hypothetical protein Ct9H300mP13_5950 [Gammaproteobacteria bacterium]